MTVFKLDRENNFFPHPKYADDDGLLAVGGDVSPERIIEAYKKCIFPWYSQEEPLLWWSPDPRYCLFPEDIRISKSLKRVLKSEKFTVKVNSDFTTVIRNCKDIPRAGQSGTWLNDSIISSLLELHQRGYAHSVETYMDNDLVGGLYGICVNGVFAGESMFSFESDASKTALYYLCQICIKLGISLIDCQIYNPFLESMGCNYISLHDLEKMTEKLSLPDAKNRWAEFTSYATSCSNDESNMNYILASFQTPLVSAAQPCSP